MTDSITRTAQAVLGQIIAGEAVSARKKRASVPENVDAALRKALEKLPADRFGSAQGFATALTDVSFRHGEEATVGVATGCGPWNRLTIAFVDPLSRRDGHGEPKLSHP